MPYKVPGVGGSFYAPGERKANNTIVWRGRDDHGTRLEVATDTRDPKAAAKYVRAHLEIRASRRPPVAGATGVALATVARHYKAERSLDEKHPDWDRLAFIVDRDGTLDIAGINNATVKATGEAWLEQRRRAVANANAELVAKKKPPRHKPPSTGTANREVITPYRALMKYAEENAWRAEMTVRSLRPPEGALPSKPPTIADDATVLALLEAIETAIETAPTEWTRTKHLHKRAFTWLCHERGYRIGEWMRFDWEWVDLPAARARMAITKKKTDLRWEEFELSPTAVAFLAALGPRDAGRIFPWHSRSNVYKWSDDFLKPLGKKWRPHESRRAIVSAIVASTGDYKQAGRYVGHASERTTYRYRILRQADLAPAVRFGTKAVGKG